MVKINTVMDFIWQTAPVNKEAKVYFVDQYGMYYIIDELTTKRCRAENGEISELELHFHIKEMGHDNG